MTKRKFLDKLRLKLSCLPKKEVDERINFYSEMIDDKIEEGILEEQAVFSVGSIDDIFSEIVSDIPITELAKQKIKLKRQLKTWEIVCLIIGSPIWIAIAIAFFAVVFSLYVSFWSVIISFWAVFASFVISAMYGAIAGVVLAIGSEPVLGFSLIGVGLILTGLAIFTYFGCVSLTKVGILLAKKVTLKVKKSFLKKENVDE